MDIQKYIVDHLNTEKAALKKQVRRIKETLRTIEESGDIYTRYEVTIVSSWDDTASYPFKGEETITVAHMDLSKALELTSTRFKEANKRSDIQGSLYVRAIVAGQIVHIPNDKFEPIKTEYSIIGFKLKEDEQCVRMADESTD